jgi:hypothetical protein
MGKKSFIMRKKILLYVVKGINFTSLPTPEVSANPVREQIRNTKF